MTADAKTWTDIEGREMEGELAGFSPGDERVTIRRGSKEFTVSLDRFAEEDRRFVLQWFEGMIKARRSTVENSIGLFPEWTLRRRAYAIPRLYLEDGLRAKAAKVYEPGDGPSLDAVTYDIEEQKAVLFVPPNYDGVTPFGVYVFIISGERGWVPNAAYREVLEKHRLISVSAYGAGNDIATFRRMALALDALASVRAEYEVDPARRFVGGASGGGVLATHTAFFYPDVFKGSFNMVRGNLLEKFELEHDPTGKYEPGTFGNQWPFLTTNEIRGIAARHPGMRWAFISGTKDYNYFLTKVSADHWRRAGFEARFFDVPEMGHVVAPANWFEKALVWMEGE